MKKGDLTIDVNDGELIRVDFLGRMSDRIPEVILVPFFDDLTEKALRKGGIVEFHFERLEFFNSTTISTIIQCLMRMRDRGVSAELRYDGQQTWQKVFFEALGMLRREDSSLVVRGV